MWFKYEFLYNELEPANGDAAVNWYDGATNG